MKSNIEPSAFLGFREQVGKQLEEARKGKNLTQEGLAQMSGLSQSTISKIEQGKWSFSIDMIYVYCNVLDLTLDLHAR